MKSILESKSRRTLHKQLAKAAENHERLREQELSLPSHAGKLVIIVSSAVNNNDQSERETHYKAFMEEADRIMQTRQGQYGDIAIRPRASMLDMAFDFADREVSDIALVGHGSIASIRTDDNGKYFGWQNAARAARHLKQGRIEQMMCGHFPLSYSVPLGTFAVSDFSNVMAAPGVMIDIPDDSPREHLFQPIYNDTDPILQQIAALNDQHKEVPAPPQQAAA